MPKLLLPYTAEFHQQIVDLACAGRALARFTRGFGLTAQVITNSIDLNGRYRGKPVSGKVSPTISRREDLVRLHSRRLLFQAEQVRHSGKLKENISSTINALKSMGWSTRQPVPPQALIAAVVNPSAVQSSAWKSSHHLSMRRVSVHLQ